MNYIGIDNGLSGAIAIISGEKCKCYDMPVLKVGVKKKYDIPEIYNLLSKYKKDSFCIIEYAQAFPGQGVNSMFSIGFGYGIVQSICVCLGIKYQIVPPKKWKLFFSICGKNKDKTDDVRAAKALYPEVNYYGPKKGLKDGVADAVLLAEYGRRSFGETFFAD